MNNSLDTSKASPFESPDSESPETLFKVDIIGNKKAYSCQFPDCGKIFRYQSEISRHIAIHLPKRPFTCPYQGCRKGFKRPDALENHMRIHTKETPYICKVQDCEMKFTTKASLRYHLLKHKDQRVYKCTFPGCNKAFITVFQLRQHEKSTCIHKRIHLENDTTNSVPNEMSNNAGLPNTCNLNMESAEMPRFYRNMMVNPSTNMTAVNVVQDFSPCDMFQERLRNIINENHFLKTRLEFSQNIIGFLQQKIQFESIPLGEYNPPQFVAENLKKFPFYNNADA